MMTKEDFDYYDSLNMSPEELKAIGDKLMQAVDVRFKADVDFYETHK